MKYYYDILGVSPTAQQEEIRTAFRKLSLKFHPDVNEGDPYFEERFKEVLEAYEVLSNPEARRNYDHKLFVNQKKTQKQIKEEGWVEPEVLASKSKINWLNVLLILLIALFIGVIGYQILHLYQKIQPTLGKKSTQEQRATTNENRVGLTKAKLELKAQEWNSAVNDKDAKTLTSLYAPNVRYFGKAQYRAAIISQKTNAQQQREYKKIKEIQSMGGGLFKVIFKAAAKTGEKHYLIFENTNPSWEIIEEGIVGQKNTQETQRIVQEESTRKEAINQPKTSEKAAPKPIAQQEALFSYKELIQSVYGVTNNRDVFEDIFPDLLEKKGFQLKSDLIGQNPYYLHPQSQFKITLQQAMRLNVIHFYYPKKQEGNYNRMLKAIQKNTKLEDSYYDKKHQANAKQYVFPENFTKIKLFDRTIEDAWLIQVVQGD